MGNSASMAKLPALAQVVHEQGVAVGSAKKRRALEALMNLSGEVKNGEEIATYPGLLNDVVSVLNSEGEAAKTRYYAARTICRLAGSASNRERMFEHPGLLGTLMASAKNGSSAEEKKWAVIALSNLADSVVTAPKMFERPGLVESILNSGVDKLFIVRAMYQFTCIDALREPIRARTDIVQVLTEGRKTSRGTEFFATLALINVFASLGDESILKVDKNMVASILRALQRSFTGEGGWDLIDPLRALRCLAVVESNRALLWSDFPDFLPQLQCAVKHAVETQDAASLEYAFAVLSQFTFDNKPLAAMKKDLETYRELVSSVDPGMEAASAAAQGLLLQLRA